MVVIHCTIVSALRFIDWYMRYMGVMFSPLISFRLFTGIREDGRDSCLNWYQLSVTAKF